MTRDDAPDCMFSDDFDCSVCEYIDPTRCDYRLDFTLLDARRRALAANPRPPDAGLETLVYEALVRTGTAHYTELADRVSAARGQWIDPGALLEVLFKRRDLFLDMAYGRFRAVTTDLTFATAADNLWLRLPRHGKVAKNETLLDAYLMGVADLVMELMAARPTEPDLAPRVTIRDVLAALGGWTIYPSFGELIEAQKQAAGDLATVSGLEFVKELIAAGAPPAIDALIEADMIIVSGDEARTRLIEGHLHLVASVARGHAGRGIEYVDLCQIGALGLIRAIETFDPSRGFALSTYATPWIRQAMTRAIADQGRSIRIPVHLHDKSPWLVREHIPHRVPVGARPTLRPVLSLERVPASAIPEVDWFQEVEDRDSMERFDAALGFLTARQREVVVRRLGLEGQEKETLDQIGHRFNLTRERIRQIEYKAFKKLRTGRVGLRRSLRA